MSKTIIIDKQDPSVTYTGSVSGLGSGYEKQLEDIKNYSNGVGTFGNIEGVGNTLASGTGSSAKKLLNGTNYLYDSLLNSGTYDIYNDADSGALTPTLFRIVHDGVNITNVSGLNITNVYAKNLQSSFLPPKANEVFVDPYIGKVALPVPAYRCQFENITSLINPDNKYGSYIPTYTINSMDMLDFQTGVDTKSVYVKSTYPTDGVLTVYPFGNPGIPFTKGTLSAFIKTAVSGTGKATSKIYISDATYLEIQNSSESSEVWVRLYVNSEKESELLTNDSNFHHFYISWSTSADLTGSKTIRVYKDNVLIFTSTTVPIVGRIGLYLFAHNANLSANCYSQMDIVHIWDHVVKDNDASWLYNSGSGRPNALHYIYGSSNYYPGTIKVGYYYIVSSTTPAQLPAPGAPSHIELEAITNLSNALGSFGSEGIMKNESYSDLSENIDYAYGKRLDASTTEDATYGFGTTSGGIFDTGASGALASGKAMRIVNDTKNIKDGTGMGLAVYAKDLSNSKISPPKDRYWVDPKLGRLMGPRPLYWSKCATLANLSAPDCGGADGPTYSASGISTTSVKFGTGLYNPAYTGYLNLYPFGSNLKNQNKLTFSAWEEVYTSVFFALYGSAQVAYFLNANTYFGMYGNSTAASAILTVNGAQTQYTLSNGVVYHIYVVVDMSAGLTGGKTIRLFVNGTERLSTKTVVDCSNYKPFFQIYCPATNDGNQFSSGYVSNIKIWQDVVSEDPSWEYNAGAGRQDALHACYGSTNGYKPTTLGVGYHKAGGDSSLVWTV